MFTEESAPSAPQAKYNASEKGKARRTKYRREKSKWTTDAKYLSREFVGWDGEGITTPNGKHLYVMLANSKGGYLANPLGIGTDDALAFILSEVDKYPDAIHVIYGGGYDFNCWLADLDRESLQRVYSQPYATVGAYSVAWRKGKSFHLSDKANKNRKVTIYDVVSFFQCAFVKACDDYLGDAFQDRDLIVENKALRSGFTLADIPTVRTYNDAELRNLVALMGELRDRLNKVTLRPKRWDGPGAIATALLTRENIKEAQAQCPADVARAARFAYAGGRFEVVKYGRVTGPAFEYDVNSAYPAALRYVPNLNQGTWHHVNGAPVDYIAPYALYHVRYTDGPSTIPGPLFRRAPNGTICYPQNLEGWYWSPEIVTAREYVARYGGKLEILESWEFVENADAVKPFEFIDGLYLKRQALKKAGDGAHVGIKLALNSLYGKTAQQVGWQPEYRGRPMRIPPFHQLEWAGYITAHCRSTVLRAAMSNLSSIIAFETDAVFSAEPLDVPIGSGLGEFEATYFSDLAYIQSGLYFGTTTDGKSIAKTRGVDRGTLTLDDALNGLAQPKAVDQVAHAQLTRFVGAGIALTQDFSRWRTWEVMPKQITLAPQGKREHFECKYCGKGPGVTMQVWHETLCPFFDFAHSAEFPVEWINPDPAMCMLSELREEPNVFEE